MPLADRHANQRVCGCFQYFRPAGMQDPTADFVSCEPMLREKGINILPKMFSNQRRHFRRNPSARPAANINAFLTTDFISNASDCANFTMGPAAYPGAVRPNMSQIGRAKVQRVQHADAKGAMELPVYGAVK